MFFHALTGRCAAVVGVVALLIGRTFYVRSLVPAQLRHVAIDLVNGIAVGATLARAQVQPAPLDAIPADVDAPAAPSA